MSTKTAQRWILGRTSAEVLCFLLPGALAVAISRVLPDLGETSLVYGLLATALIDSGHVYTTAWRTVFYPQEFVRDRRYWLFPLGFFALFALWHGSGLPWLWNFVVYSTFYHHVRQFYGFSKWYQALNRRMDITSDRFLYGFALVALTGYHFRRDVVTSYYTTQDLFMWPSDPLYRACIVAYLALWICWAIREWGLWQSGVSEPNRLLSVAFPALIYGHSFLIGETLTQVLFPLLFVHGVAYCAVMSRALHRTQRARFRTLSLATGAVVATAVLFGLGESWYGEHGDDLLRDWPGAVKSLAVGLSLTPLYCHYAFDAIIWRRSHREAPALYGE